jgi:hypothetical protein
MGVDFESLVEATSGAVGGVVSTSILYPLDTWKTKLNCAPARHRDMGTQPFPFLSRSLMGFVMLGFGVAWGAMLEMSGDEVLQFSSRCVAGGDCEAAAPVAVSGVGRKECTVHYLPVRVLLRLQLLQAAVSAVGEGEGYGNWSESCRWCGCWGVHCFSMSGEAPLTFLRRVVFGLSDLAFFVIVSWG